MKGNRINRYLHRLTVFALYCTSVTEWFIWLFLCHAVVSFTKDWLGLVTGWKSSSLKKVSTVGSKQENGSIHLSLFSFEVLHDVLKSPSFYIWAPYFTQDPQVLDKCRLERFTKLQLLQFFCEMFWNQWKQPKTESWINAIIYTLYSNIVIPHCGELYN